MFMAGINFVLYFRLLRTGRLRLLWEDPEWRCYAGIAGAASLAFAAMLVLAHDRPWPGALIDGSFQAVSILTTTGFSTDNFDAWHSFGRVGLLGLMMVGGMAGSTGGGVKVVRIRVLVASARLVLRRLISPRAVLHVRLGERIVPPVLVAAIHSFFVVFLLQLALGTLVLALLGHDLETGLSGTLACLSNIGPGLGELGPAGNYAGIHPAGKLLLSWLMLLGRLELFTILVMFSVHYWKR
jgi:trk system potassium uptake protein TrkH